MFDQLKKRHREYQRRLQALQDLVREEPGEIEGRPVVHLVVDDETAWRRAWNHLHAMGAWPFYRAGKRPEPAPSPPRPSSATPRGDVHLWRESKDPKRFYAGRLAMWATARVERQGPADSPWCIVDDASNPVDARAAAPGRSAYAARAAWAGLERDGAIVPPATQHNDPGRVESLCYATEAEALARIDSERRKAAWIVLFDLLLPPPGNLDDLDRGTRELYRSLCLDDDSPELRRDRRLHQARSGATPASVGRKGTR